MIFWGLECSLLVLMHPIGWALAALAIIASARANINGTWSHWAWLWLAWPVLMAVLTLVWGQTHWCDPEHRNLPVSTTPLHVILAIYVVGCLLGIVLTRKARGATIAVLSFGSFFFLGCYFVATMAVTGLWL
jgi:hypothetical protein